MSKSSNALLRAIYGWPMRNAAPILFCTSLLLFVGTIATYSYAYWIPMLDGDPSTTVNIYFLLDGLIAAINNSALIFAGAAIVWAVSKNGARA